MSKRIGTTLVFKEGVTTAEAAMALNGIRHLLDLPTETSEPDRHVQGALDSGYTVRFRPEEWRERPFRMTDKIHEFDDHCGRPVWYIP